MKYRSAIIFLCFLILVGNTPFSGAQSNENKDITLKVADPSSTLRWILSVNGSAKRIFNMSEYLTAGEVIPASRPALSPDNRYFALASQKGDHSANSSKGLYLILINNETTSLTKTQILTDELIRLGITGFQTITWTSPDSVDIRIGRFHFYHILYNINTGTHQMFESSLLAAVDSQGKNYAQIEGADQAFEGREQMVPGLFERNPFYLRYNGYWVYPKPIKGYLSIEDMRQFNLSNEVSTTQASVDYADVLHLKETTKKSGGYKVFSSLLFVPETQCVAFVEQTYEWGDPDKILSTQIVAIDAHAVHTNPPDPKDIKVQSWPISPIGLENGYLYFARQVTIRWNVVEHKLEAVKLAKWLDDPNYRSPNPLDMAIGSADIEIN